MVRTIRDQTMTIAPCNMQLLFHGTDPTARPSDDDEIPYRLGLLTADW